VIESLLTCDTNNTKAVLYRYENLKVLVI